MPGSVREISSGLSRTERPSKRRELTFGLGSFLLLLRCFLCRRSLLLVYVTAKNLLVREKCRWKACPAKEFGSQSVLRRHSRSTSTGRRPVLFAHSSHEILFRRFLGTGDDLLQLVFLLGLGRRHFFLGQVLRGPRNRGSQKRLLPHVAHEKRQVQLLFDFMMSICPFLEVLCCQRLDLWGARVSGS